jgi:uncharacterized oxidoreductase
MRMHGNTILITGGSSGIGLALAERFLALGNTVAICGRNQAALQDVRQRLPALQYVVSDTGLATDREALAQWAVENFPDLNILINNAGIQRKFDLKQDEDWQAVQQEIAINLCGPIHLSMLLLPHLIRQSDAWILNVSSGLAFAPLAAAPVYCATKAGIHSFTQSLRQQLQGTSVGIIEIIPPAVKTNLGGAHDFGAGLDDFADAIMKQLGEGKLEATYGTSSAASQASRPELDAIFLRMNQR